MRIPPIKSKVIRFLEIRKYEKEQKFLNKFCNISNEIEGDTFTQLNSARKTIANYAKSKGVTVDIEPGNSTNVVTSYFKTSSDGKKLEKIADVPDIANLPKDKLRITVRSLEKLPERKGGKLLSTSEYVSKDTSETHLHTVNDYFVVEIPEDGLQQIRLTKHENEDNFLRHIYRVIENNVKAIEHYFNK